MGAPKRKTEYSMGQRLFALFLALYDANGDDTVTLDDVWTILDAAGRIDSANFYLSLDCEIADNMSNGFQGTPPTTSPEPSTLPPFWAQTVWGATPPPACC